MRTTLLIATLLSGCIRPAGPPQPGDCAQAPDNAVYTWGDIGIGTCLSGPAHMDFFERDGRTYLGVTNANPYLDFSSGSFLVVDWDSVDVSRDRNLMSDLDAGAISLDNYVGGFDLVDERDLGLVAGRLSEGAARLAFNDRLTLLDLSVPLSPRLNGNQNTVRVKDDPFPVTVDAEQGVAYVGNLTDNSVSVMDVVSDDVRQVDVAPGTLVTPGALNDADNSGSMAELFEVDILLPELLNNDLWTLSFIDATTRIWVPTVDPSAESGQTGLVRYTDVGTGAEASPLGIEVDTATFGVPNDPHYVTLDVARLYYGDAEGTTIWRIGSSGTIGEWDPDSLDAELIAAESGWDAVIGAPAVMLTSDDVWMAYEGRAEADGPASIGLALPTGGDLYANAAAPVLDPADHDAFVSFEDPHVFWDVTHNSHWMWMTATVTDGRRVIARSRSDDRLTWTAPEVVLEDPVDDLSGPDVHLSNGRFQIWYTRDTGTDWTHELAWSYDGRDWFFDRTVVVSDLPYAGADAAPTVAVQLDVNGTWRLEGRDQGPSTVPVGAGSLYINGNQGFAIRLSQGHEVQNEVVPDNRARFGLIPGSWILLDGVPTLYVTQVAEDRSRLGVLQWDGADWISTASNLIPAGEGGNRAGVSDPVVVATDDGYTLFYTAESLAGVQTVRRATSTDGIAFTPVGGDVLATSDDWDDVEQRAHSIETTDTGVRLWYTGGNGSRLRIGSATASDPNGAFTEEPGAFDPWRFEPGVGGSFDDAGVRDPAVYTDELGVTHLYYAGFDGTAWGIGHATLNEDGTFERRIEDTTDQSLPAVTGSLLSYASFGVYSPVLLSGSSEHVEFLLAGTDGLVDRIGRAVGTPDRPFLAQRYPTVGDTIAFDLVGGTSTKAAISLTQSVEAFNSPGIEMAGLVHDVERGFVIIPSKVESYLYVLDVRDDSGGTFSDANYLDLETVVLVENLSLIGFRDVVLDPVRDRLYATSRSPESVVVLDLDDWVDNDAKEVTWNTAIASLPMQSSRDDAGVATVASIGGDGMALTADNRYLLAAHHRGNGVSVFDLEQGAAGEEIAWIAHIGENPHQVLLTPDGRYALVANYVGVVTGQETSSTIAVVDVDPSSPTFLEVVTWLANR